MTVYIAPTLDNSCALCNTNDNIEELYPERIYINNINFSARRTPSRNHFRIVECKKCGLIFSNPIFPQHEIYEFYKTAVFLNEVQLLNMRKDYAHFFTKKTLPFLKERGSLLEIGCSNGFFLEEASQLGFKKVIGIEPGIDAVRKANSNIKTNIINGFFSAEYFKEESFDAICLFQVIDHLLNMDVFLRDVFRILKNGGIVTAIHHNIRSWLPTFLGERCPMFDIEHIYLFDKSTISKLFKKYGFEVILAKNISNSYVVEYSLKMFPMSACLKQSLIFIASKTGLMKKFLKFPAGNMLTIAKKPEKTIRL